MGTTTGASGEGVNIHGSIGSIVVGEWPVRTNESRERDAGRDGSGHPVPLHQGDLGMGEDIAELK